MSPKRKILVFTGSGISAESGVPTYRSDNGTWENYDLEKVCTFSTYHQNIELVHKFYNEARQKLMALKEDGTRLIQPNVAHRLVAQWQRDFGATILTQNIDDLHEEAGAKDVVHLHGRLQDMKCLSCGHEWDNGWGDTTPGDVFCPNCGSDDVKPGVIFFGENAPHYQRLQKEIEALNPGDIVVVIGTSGQVVPIDIYLSGKMTQNYLLNKGPHDGHPMTPGMEHIWAEVLYGDATYRVPQMHRLLENLQSVEQPVK